jgi:hypothetical protein
MRPHRSRDGAWTYHDVGDARCSSDHAERLCPWVRAEPVAPDPGLTYRRSVLVHEDDTTVVQLRRRTCLRLDPRADGRELLVEVGHSVIERVHHVDVDESADEVAVSACGRNARRYGRASTVRGRHGGTTCARSMAVPSAADRGRWRANDTRRRSNRGREHRPDD